MSRSRKSAHIRRHPGVPGLLLSALLAMVSQPAGAQTPTPLYRLLQSTTLIELTQGSEWSRLMREYSGQGYESSAGDRIRFHPWYSTRWTDARLTFMTQVDRNLGIIWGFSTGEAGKKYSVGASLKLGLAFATEIGKGKRFSFKATRIFGGRLKESSCIADYGDIGGVQEVNCRLAATELQPSETLKYLLDRPAYNQNVVLAQFTMEF